MPDETPEHDEDFNLSWCKALDNDPSWINIPCPSRVRHQDTSENGLVARTLGNAMALRGMRTYIRRQGETVLANWNSLSTTATTDTNTDPDSKSTVATTQKGQSQGQGQGHIDESMSTEVRVLFSLGSGVDGIASWCHGGMLALMLDETTGQLASNVFGRYNIVTGGLNIRYKIRVSTPRVVLCRAWVQRASEAIGRKVVIEGTVEDGMGTVFCTGQAIFVRLDGRL